MTPFGVSPERGHLVWAQVPYLPEPPLEVLAQGPKNELRVALTFKMRPVLVVQNRQDNAHPAYPFALPSPNLAPLAPCPMLRSLYRLSGLGLFGSSMKGKKGNSLLTNLNTSGKIISGGFDGTPQGEPSLPFLLLLGPFLARSQVIYV